LLPIETQSDVQLKEEMIEDIVKSLRTLEITQIRLLKAMVYGMRIYKN